MACLVALPLVACDKDKHKGPDAEVKKTDVKLDLPAVPAFDLPAAPSDGSRTVKELRVKGKKLLDTEVTVELVPVPKDAKKPAQPGKGQ